MKTAGHSVKLLGRGQGNDPSEKTEGAKGWQMAASAWKSSEGNNARTAKFWMLQLKKKSSINL